MFRKLTILVCLISFCPAAVGAQDLTTLSQSPVVIERTADPQAAREVDLSLPAARLQAATVLAQNDPQGAQGAATERPRKSHTGLTLEEFCEVHFGEYRWIYWVGAAAILVAIHVVAARD
jgi:hypothetical protein